jgi:hypothetical protein
MGYKANNFIEKSMSAKTETSVESREARTTEAETAAFIERTEESLKLGINTSWENKENGKKSPFVCILGFGCSIVSKQSIQDEQGRGQSPDRV